MKKQFQLFINCLSALVMTSVNSVLVVLLARLIPSRFRQAVRSSPVPIIGYLSR